MVEPVDMMQFWRRHPFTEVNPLDERIDLASPVGRVDHLCDKYPNCPNWGMVTIRNGCTLLPGGIPLMELIGSRDQHACSFLGAKVAIVRDILSSIVSPHAGTFDKARCKL